MTKIEFQNRWYELEALLFGFAMKLTRNKEDAKDLMQETVLRAFRNRSRYKMNTNFKAWTTTIMRNTFINNYRKKRTRNKVEAPIEDFLFSIESRASNDLADSEVRTKDLFNVLNILTDTYKIPFTMAFQGYEYKEIAETLDIPIGTVKSRIHIARKKLREEVEARYGKLARA